jgi:predicted O-linked N-acetylglucosamine transferase (SPINDLY family)
MDEVLSEAWRRHQGGDLVAAERAYRQVLRSAPTCHTTWHLLGVLLCQAGELSAGVDALGRAASLDQQNAEFQSNLGLALEAVGRGNEALSCFRQSVQLQPDFAEAHFNLANALKKQGHWAHAIEAYRRALRLQPDFAEAFHNLGNTWHETGRLHEAVECYRQATRLAPDSPELQNRLGTALSLSGQMPEAIVCFREAVRLRPDDAHAHNNLGYVLQSTGRPAEALASFDQAIRCEPAFALAHSNRALALHHLGRLDDALAASRDALRIEPDRAAARNNLGMTLKEMGRLDESLASFRRAAELQPDVAAHASNALYTLHFHPQADARLLADEHRRWSRRYADPLSDSSRSHLNVRNADRKLRVGYVSPDLRHHPVGHFLLPILENHDRSAFETFCYSSSHVVDEWTQQLRGRSDAWRAVGALDDEQLARQIADDQIDVLVDLSAHMADHRLLTFARRPAPVQVTYLGYCSTTGMQAMNYRLTDPYLDPPAHDVSCYAEQSTWLPETYWCYQPAGATPDRGPLPMSETGSVTFGCLNTFSKVSRGALETWRDLLVQIADSRLVLHAHPGSHRDRVAEFFSSSGIEPHRIEFVGYVPRDEYLSQYCRIDIALDPFPYAGGTTTCDALWMGVPVITLAGQTAVGRGGISILSNVGLHDLIARSTEEYIQIASSLAADVNRLQQLRSGLRDRMLASPLCDAPRFARNLESAYRQMWRNWCESPAG